MASILKITSVGEKELLAKIKAMGPAGMNAARKVIYRKAEEIAGKAKDEVPVDTGALKSTIHVELDEDQNSTSASIVAGGPSAGYGAIVHEDLTARHVVGGAKYIERPFLEVLPSIAPAIVKELGRVVRGK